MPDVADIAKGALKTPKGALKTLRKNGKPSIKQLKSPGGAAAAGAALAALPFAAERVAKLVGGSNGHSPSDLGDKAKEVTKKAGKAMGGGSGSDEEEAGQAHGSGRRMPIQQSVDVAVPIEDAYNLWTQFEEWPEFMHRVDSAQQLDDTTVSFSTKVWGITKEFKASIVEQRPDERIEWEVEEGLSHTGVVTFHRLAPRLTRIEVTLDVKPDSLVEKAGRGMRFSKRAVRGDLHRFKAYAEMEEHPDESGWRGTIKDGDVRRKTDRPKRSGNGGSRRRSKSSSGSKAKSRSRPKSKSGSQSRSRSKSGSQSRSRSKSGSKSKSRS
jgi:uncharacterized membrane protein